MQKYHISYFFLTLLCCPISYAMEFCFASECGVTMRAEVALLRSLLTQNLSKFQGACLDDAYQDYQLLEAYIPIIEIVSEQAAVGLLNNGDLLPKLALWAYFNNCTALLHKLIIVFPEIAFGNLRDMRNGALLHRAYHEGCGDIEFILKKS